MPSLEALQDRFGRNVVFRFFVRVADPAKGLGELLSRIASAGGAVGQTALEEVQDRGLVYRLDVFVEDDEQAAAARAAIEAGGPAEVLDVRDLAVESHRGGACEMRSRTSIRSNTDMRIVYTPGVARLCRAIQADPSRARELTNLANKVAIVTNGTAILGLGDIGPVAGLPVMEGKAAIFWEFAGISAEPILVDTRRPEEFISVVEKIACTFGAIQIEDVAAPECFEITRTLDERLAIPVFHDDQHGTATVVLAGLYSALRRTGRRIEEISAVISGAGAAGTAIAELLLRAGAGDVVLCDRAGAIYRGRTEHMNPAKEQLARRTNRENFRGSLAEAMKGRNLFIGVSRPNLVSAEMV
ncbi:MAG: NADP-dependent malic enzyme, partial [Planctomycetes bacterium]|nr:NADP-dependent malic enzyme [Planctomycetota bacterium]